MQKHASCECYHRPFVRAVRPKAVMRPQLSVLRLLFTSQLPHCAGSPHILLTYRALLFCYCLGLGVSQTVTRGVWVFAYYTMW